MFFFSRKPDGELKFGYIDEIQSSADFTITWDGKFQSDNTQIEFLNCADQLYPVFNFQAMENGVRVYKVLEPIEKYLEVCPIQSIFAMEHVEIPDNQINEIKYTPILHLKKLKNYQTNYKNLAICQQKNEDD
jgi:hypothetical protein